MIPLYKPYIPKLPELEGILYSGKLAAGEYTKRFETKLNEYLKTDDVLVTSTFNMAISVAITACGLKYGDEIIVSPMACLASTQPYLTAGLKIIWADIDPHTGTLDPDSVKKKITNNTKAIIHNHFCGYPGYIDEINEIGKDNGIIVIDDGIECFGSLYKGKPLGNCGSDVTVFSFNPVRVLTTIDGGAVVIKDEEIRKKASLIRDCGIDRTRFRDDLGEINPNCDITLQGYSATLSNVNAYIGIEQFKDLDYRLEKQINNAKRWDDYFKCRSHYEPLSIINGRPNYWVYGMLVKDKRQTIEKFREGGIYASGVHINNNIYSIFGNADTLKGVDDFYKSFVAIPSGWWIDEDIWSRDY